DITGDDPLYTSRLGELAAPSASNVNRPATCIGSGATATIAYTPGYYTDVRVLTQTASPCNNSSVTRWFQPGVYYFDFDFDAAITAVAGKDWPITGTVVGGTPKCWTPGVTQPPTPGPGIVAPAACQAPGAQFVFGGGSTVSFPSDTTVS